MTLTQKTAFVLIGLPGSGKSYWRATRRSGFRVQQTPTVVYSSDDILEAIAERDGITYNEAFATHASHADWTFWEQLERGAVVDDRVIFVDRTNVSAKGRRRIVQALRHRHKVEHIIAVVFRPPTVPKDIERWKEILASRPGKTIPPTVIDSMTKNFTIPTVDEGFDSIYYPGECSWNF